MLLATNSLVCARSQMWCPAAGPAPLVTLRAAKELVQIASRPNLGVGYKTVLQRAACGVLTSSKGYQAQRGHCVRGGCLRAGPPAPAAVLVA